MSGVASAGQGQPVPVGAERYPVTASVLPLSGSPRGWPVSGFHSRAVPSRPGARKPTAHGASSTRCATCWRKCWSC